MKLSTKSRYALRCMIDIASSDTVISINKISTKQHISERYLELIFAKLKKGKLIISIRGNQGGYCLAKSPEDITVYDIIRIMETTNSIVKSKVFDDPLKLMLQNQIWAPIDHNLEIYLKSIKLSSLI